MTRSDEVPAGEVFPILILVLIVTAGSVVHGVYEGLGRPLPYSVPILEQVTFWLAVWAWFTAYAARQRLALAMDLGWFFFGLWVVLVPYFLFKTQGWRALIPIGAYILLVVVSSGVGTVVRFVLSQQ